MARHTAKSLPFTLPALLRAFLDGRAQAMPVSAPDLTACSDDADPTFELELFLQAHLPTIPADQLSRLALPPESTLLEVDVPLTPTHLPDRLQSPLLVRFPCVLIPLAKARWVILPTLQRHTFFLAPDADPPQAIRAEIQRIVSAADPSPQAFLSLLPSASHALRWLTVPLDLAQTLSALAQARARQRALAKAAQRKQAIAVLESVGKPLHAHLPEAPPPFVHQDAALKALSSLMRGRGRASVLVLGPPLVGKSTLVRAWLWRARREPNDTTRLYALSGAQLMAGMSGLGQWQARALRILEAAEALNAILFFEDMRDLFAERADHGVDLPGAFKPFIEDGRVRVLGCLADHALDHLERGHGPFFAPFQRLYLRPLTPVHALDALRAYAAPLSPPLSADAAPAVIDLLHRYQPYQAFPGKAARFLDTLRALHAADPLRAPHPITAADALRAFALDSGLPAFLLHDDQPLKRATLLQHFRRRVIGQAQAIDRLCDLLCTVKANLQPPQKPLATLLFLGPTGVGKTEVARALSEVLFSSPDRMLRFDMSEYADYDAPERLIHGSTSAEGLLTRQVRQQPFSVLLLDEVEKAHPSVFDLLLQVCGEGRLTDAHGRTAYFYNTILILTSNLGASTARAASPGFTPPSHDAASAHYLDAVHRHFRPEFVNRLDRVIPFSPLSAPELRQVTQLVAQRIAARHGLSSHQTPLQLSDACLDALSAAGSDPAYGARALRRFLDLHLATPIASLLAATPPSLTPCALRASTPLEPLDPDLPSPLATLTNAHLRLDLLPLPAPKHSGHTPLSALDALLNTRRAIHRALALPPVEQLLARRQQLIADVNDLSRRIKRAQTAGAPDPRLSAEMGLLQGELASVDGLWSRTSQHLTNLHDAEELSLLALYDAQDPAPFLDEGHQQASALQRLLVPLLLSQVRGRDAVTLLLQGHDGCDALGDFLRPLLAAAPSRRWDLSCHLLSNHGLPAASLPPPPPSWPPDLIWTPRLPSEHLAAWLDLPRDLPRAPLILCAEGPLVGAFLALVSGLHRRTNPPATPGGPSLPASHLTLQRLAMRARLSLDELRALSPEPPSLPNDLQRLTPTHERANTSQLRVLPPPPMPDSPTLYRDASPTTHNLHPDDLWLHFEDIALPLLLSLQAHDPLDASPVFMGTFDLKPPDEATKKKKPRKDKRPQDPNTPTGRRVKAD